MFPSFSSNSRPIRNSNGKTTAEHPMHNSAMAYRWSRGDWRRGPYLRTRYPAPNEPRPKPAIKLESTIDTIAVVTPNCAMAKRSQISSYRMLQNPEIKKKPKYHFQLIGAPAYGFMRCARGAGSRTLIVLGMVSVLTGTPLTSRGANLVSSASY